MDAEEIAFKIRQPTNLPNESVKCIAYAGIVTTLYTANKALEGRFVFLVRISKDE